MKNKLPKNSQQVIKSLTSGLHKATKDFYTEHGVEIITSPLHNNPTTFEEAFDSVIAEIRQLMLSKQHDYGHRNITDFGELGVLVRVNDKINRLKNLQQSGKAPQNESIEDSWRDIVNYGIIVLMLRKGTFELPLDDTANKPMSFVGGTYKEVSPHDILIKDDI